LLKKEHLRVKQQIKKIADVEKNDKIGNLALEMEEDENLLYMNDGGNTKRSSDDEIFDTHGK
jgi:hypothetical protein